MAKVFTGKSLAAVLGTGLALGAAQTQAAPAVSDENPFGARVFQSSQGTVVAAAADEQGKDGEHKCGAEGKCGSSN